MELEIIKSSYGTSEITVNGKKMLAVTTNFKSKIYKQITLQDLLSESGFLIKDNIKKKWETTESLEYNGNLIFPGPYYEGKTLADNILNIDILINLADAFNILIQEEIPYTGLYLPGIFIPDDGGILIFPPSLINHISCQLTEQHSVELWQPYNHPDASGELQFSFILSVLAYKLLTKQLPYNGITITEIREKMRTSKPLEIELLVPGINADIALLINKSLNLKNVKIEEWIKVLKIWKDKNPIELINNDKKLQIQKSAAIRQKKRNMQFKRKQFFTHNWKTIVIISAVIIFLFSISLQPIKQAMEPPVTLGMSEEQVVQTFYRGIIEMDTSLMEDCVKKGIAKNDINEVSQLYVISRVRTGYEGKSGLVSAQEWNDGVITKLEQGDQVYGIADLKISRYGDYIFYADYVKWYPDIRDETDSATAFPPTKIFVRDKITMEKLKGVWKIIRLERNNGAENND